MGVFMPRAQVVKWGNSLAVRIPKTVAEEARMQEGDAIVIVAKKGRVELRRTDKVPALEDLVTQITPKNRYEETTWGPDKGKEIIEW
jgi:antitoxin MazE